MPKKPDRPFVVIAFSKSGKVSSDVEHVPDSTEDIELVVARKLLAVLTERRRFDVSTISHGEEPADVAVRLADGNTIDIQVAEIVDQVTARSNQIADSYKQVLLNDEGKVLDVFHGIVITVATALDAVPLPKLSSEEGIEALSSIVSLLRDEAQSISSLPLGHFRSRKRTIANQDVSFVFDHLASPNAPAEIHWQPALGLSPPGGTRFVTQTIANKIQKRYSKPKNAFWLLVFGTDTEPPHQASPDYLEARQLLATATHPFDEVWYIWPLANQDAGAILQIWP